MLWHKWVVLIAGSTGSALRAVRPPNLHITPLYDDASQREWSEILHVNSWQNRDYLPQVRAGA
jgi:hypothetical protein